MIKKLDRNILHICNNFFGTDAYSNVFEEVKNNSINSHILVIMPSSAKNDPQYLKKRDCFNETTHIIWESNCIYKILRFFPYLRFLKVKNLILKLNRAYQFDLVHSHTLFSNGSIGKHISRLLKIPHIVSVRNVDVNEVFKYLFILNRTLRNILKDATSIIFLSPAYRDRTISIFEDDKSNNIASKSFVIPSAIDDFWNQNIGKSKKLPECLQLLFVGEISPNKNIHFLIELFLNNWSRGKFNITIIGGTKDKIENIKYLSFLKDKYSLYSEVNFLDEITKKEELLKHYKNATIFFMASIKETFGLVYFEAISQGTPVIFSQEQGIDGYFPQGFVGYSIDPSNYEDALKKVKLLVNNYEKISNNCINSITKITRSFIINKWVALYSGNKN